MTERRRRLLSLLMIALAGAASLATQQGPPTVDDEPSDRLSFVADQRSEVRQVTVEVTSGESDAHVTADIPIDIGGLDDGIPPIGLSVTRNSDGASVLEDFGPGFKAGTEGYLAGWFVAIESCPKGETCAQSFTFTFERVPEDRRATLDADWSVRASAEYLGRSPGSSPPVGAFLEVRITR